jgi:hypothetical protein
VGYVKYVGEEDEEDGEYWNEEESGENGEEDGVELKWV